ncbi:MAG: hypothetical protein ACPGSL_02645 [Vicingaceae bacterium]
MVQTYAIELNSSKVWVDADDIIWQDYKLTKSLSLQEAEEIHIAVNEVAANVPGEKKLFLSSMVGLLGMSKEARDYFGTAPTQFDWKVALVYNSSMAHILTMLMLKILVQKFETKSFNNLETAINWFKEEAA